MKYESKIDKLEALLVNALICLSTFCVVLMAFAFLPVYYYRTFGWKGPIAYFLIPPTMWLVYSILKNKCIRSRKKVD